MKKIVYIVMVLTFLFSSYFAVKLYGDYDYNASFVSNKNQTVHIEDKDNKLSSEEYLNKIKAATDLESLSIKRIVYTPINNGKSTKSIYYVYNSEKDSNSFFKDISLNSGRFIKNTDSKDVFLSNRVTGDTRQIGRINLFNNTNEIEIRDLSAMQNHIYGTDYVLSTESKEKTDKFVSDIKDMGLTCSVNSSNTANCVQFDFQFYSVYFGLIVCLYILCAVGFLYYLIFRFKEFAIQKMLGYQNKNIIRSIIIKDAIPIIGISLIISICITLIYIFFYNHFSKFLSFLFMWFIIQIFVAVFALLTFFLVCQVIRTSKSSSSIKNKKPLTLIKGLNYSVKSVFSIAAVILLSMAIQNINIIQSQNKDLAKWNQTQNYAVVGFTVDDSVMDDYKSEYEFNEKMRYFFEELDRKGGFLLSASTYYNDMNNKEYDKFPSYSPWKNSVSINNNYLKLNPIRDSNGNIVSVKNDGSTNTTLLVPQKYKSKEQDIIKLYKDYKSKSYFSQLDRYQKICGKDPGYDCDNPDEVLKHHSPLNINIIYVKDGQKYFTYDADICQKQSNEIIDPIAMIVTDKNSNNYSYPSFISRGEMRAFVNDYNNPSASLTTTIKEAKLEDNIVVITSLYDKFGEHIYNVTMQIAIELAIMIIAMIIVLSIVVFSSMNYLEESKLINAVKSINGYSFFDRHKTYLLTTAVFWMFIFVAMIGLCLSKILTISLAILGIVGLLIFDEAVSIVVIFLNESKKQKDILKGG